MVGEVKWGQGRKALSFLGALVTSPSPSHIRGGRRGPCVLHTEPWEWDAGGGATAPWSAGGGRSPQVYTCCLPCPAPLSCVQRAAHYLWHLKPHCCGHQNLNWKLCDNAGPLPATASCWEQSKEGRLCPGHKWTSIKTNSRERGGLVPIASLSPSRGHCPHKARLRPGWDPSSVTFPCTECKPQPTGRPCHPQNSPPNWKCWIVSLSAFGGENYPKASWLCAWRKILF